MRISMPVAALAIAVAAQAQAQQPTQAQASAIRSACRGDYQTYCSSVPTGGMASLQCLQQNASSVSAGCQQALSAVSGGGQSAAAPPPGVSQPMGAPMGQPMGQPMAPPSYRPPAYRPPPPPPPPLSPRQEMRIVRESCGYDFHRFCSGVPLGGGRAIGCLKANGPSLSRRCQFALMQMKGSR